jgi:hypothetical protein
VICIASATRASPNPPITAVQRTPAATPGDDHHRTSARCTALAKSASPIISKLRAGSNPSSAGTISASSQIPSVERDVASSASPR